MYYFPYFATINCIFKLKICDDKPLENYGEKSFE